MVSSSFPPPKQLPSLDTNRAVDTFCSTLISCLDTICPLSYRQARATPSAPCLTGKPVPPLLPLVLQASPCHPFCPLSYRQARATPSAPCLTGKPVPPLLPLVLQASLCHPFCPLSYRQARAIPSAPWLSDVLREHCSKLRAAENQTILLTLMWISHSSLPSLLMSPLLKGHTIITKWTIRLTLACSLKHFPHSFVLLLLHLL